MRSLAFLPLLIYSIAALNSLFITLVYILSRKGRRTLNRMLAVIFLVSTLRLAKSVGIHFFEDFHDSAHAVWFAGLAYSAVLLYLYVAQVFRSSPAKRIAGIHLLPPTVIFLVIVFYRGQLISTWPEFDDWIYRAVCFFFVLYLLMSYRKNQEAVRASFRYSPAAQWVGRLLIFFAGEGLLLVIYLFVPYYVPDVESYYFSLAVYLFIFMEMRSRLVSRAHQRDPSTPGSDDLGRRLVAVMENEKLYLASGLSLPLLAKRVGTTPNALSRFVNTRFSKNFNDYINSYRIEEAKRRLKDSAGKQTISAIAMECGFNSISVFNQAFKKITGKTPSQFHAER